MNNSVGYWEKSDNTDIDMLNTKHTDETWWFNKEKKDTKINRTQQQSTGQELQ